MKSMGPFDGVHEIGSTPTLGSTLRSALRCIRNLMGPDPLSSREPNGELVLVGAGLGCGGRIEESAIPDALGRHA
jgi:hypothetical protein